MPASERNLEQFLQAAPFTALPSVTDSAERILARSRERPSSALTAQERHALRRARLRKSDLDRINTAQLSEKTTIPLWRAHQLRSLDLFRKLRSVGTAAAEDLFELGYDEPSDLKGEHPLAMYLAHSVIAGRMVDRCVEDVFRCCVAQVEFRHLSDHARDWWAWTPYRGENRFPNNKLPSALIDSSQLSQQK